MTILLWILALFSITGTVLNIQRNRWCFVIWIVTNGCWCVYNLWVLHSYQQGAIFLVYAGLAVWGVVRWSPGKSACGDEGKWYTYKARIHCHKIVTTHTGV